MNSSGPFRQNSLKHRNVNAERIYLESGSCIFVFPPKESFAFLGFSRLFALRFQWFAVSCEKFRHSWNCWEVFFRQEPLFCWESGGQRRLVIDSETHTQNIIGLLIEDKKSGYIADAPTILSCWYYNLSNTQGHPYYSLEQVTSTKPCLLLSWI